MNKQYIKSHVVLSQDNYQVFKKFLIENGIKYEPSGYGVNVYVALTVTSEQYKQIDEFLETM